MYANSQQLNECDTSTYTSLEVCELERILDTGLNVTVLQGYNVLMRGPANVEETDRTYIYKIMTVIYCKAQATTSILYRL